MRHDETMKYSSQCLFFIPSETFLRLTFTLIFNRSVVTRQSVCVCVWPWTVKFNLWTVLSESRLGCRTCFSHFSLLFVHLLRHLSSACAGCFCSCGSCLGFFSCLVFNTGPAVKAVQPQSCCGLLWLSCPSYSSAEWTRGLKDALGCSLLTAVLGYLVDSELPAAPRHRREFVVCDAEKNPPTFRTF